MTTDYGPPILTGDVKTTYKGKTYVSGKYAKQASNIARSTGRGVVVVQGGKPVEEVALIKTEPVKEKPKLSRNDIARKNQFERTGVWPGSIKDYQRIVAPTTRLTGQVVRIKKGEVAKDILKRVRRASDQFDNVIVESKKAPLPRETIGTSLRKIETTKDNRPKIGETRVSAPIKDITGTTKKVGYILKPNQKYFAAARGSDTTIGVRKAEVKTELAKITERVKDKLDSDRRIRNAIQTYKNADEEQPIAKAMFELSLGLAIGAGTTKALQFISSKVGKIAVSAPKLAKTIRATGKVASGALGTVYVGGLPVRIVQTGGDPTKLFLEFAGDAGFFAGATLAGGLKLKDIKKAKVTDKDIKKFFGGKRPTERVVKAKFKMSKSKSERAKIIKAYWQDIKELPKTLFEEFSLKSLGKKGSAGRSKKVSKQKTVTKQKKKEKKKKKKKVVTEKDIKKIARIQQEKLRKRAIEKKEVQKLKDEPIRFVQEGKNKKKLFVDFDKLIKKGYTAEDINKILKKLRESTFIGSGVSKKRITELFKFLNKQPKPKPIEVKALQKVLPKKTSKRSVQEIFRLMNPNSKLKTLLRFDMEFVRVNNKFSKELAKQLSQETLKDVTPKLSGKTATEIRQIYLTALKQKTEQLTKQSQLSKTLQSELQKQQQKAIQDILQNQKALQKQKQKQKQKQDQIQRQKVKQDQKQKQITKQTTQQQTKPQITPKTITTTLKKTGRGRPEKPVEPVIVPKPKVRLAIKLPPDKKKKKKKKGIPITIEDVLKYTPTLRGVEKDIIERRIKETYTGLEVRGVKPKSPLVKVAKGGKTRDGRRAQVKPYSRRIPSKRDGKAIKTNVAILKKFKLYK